MLVRFSSVETESITMFGDVAVQLIRMLGATGAVPGAISADDIPAALNRLRRQVQASDADEAAQTAEEKDSDDDEVDREPPIALGTRAVPLINILERAGAAQVPVMWEKLH